MNHSVHLTLRSDVQIRAYLHRTRMDILTALRDGPATASQIAAALGVHPANLTRHVRTLVDAGLVELDHARDAGRNLEKYYRSVAQTFDAAPDSDSLEAPHKVALEFARSDLSAAIAQLPDALEQPVLALVAMARIPRRRVPGFFRRIQAIARQFEASDSDDGAAYHVNLSIYPGPWNAADPTVSLKPTEDSR